MRVSVPVLNLQLLLYLFCHPRQYKEVLSSGIYEPSLLFFWSVWQKITLSVFFLKNKDINGQFLSHENLDNFFFCVSTFWDVWILHFIKTKPENVILKKFLNLFSINLFITNYLEGSSRSWSNGNWIYNYLCNQCLSPIRWRVRIPLMARCTRYNILCDKVSQWLAAGWWFSPSIKLTAMIQLKYCWKWH